MGGLGCDLPWPAHADSSRSPGSQQNLKTPDNSVAVAAKTLGHGALISSTNALLPPRATAKRACIRRPATEREQGAGWSPAVSTYTGYLAS